MAHIRCRKDSTGRNRYQAIVRIAGHPAASRTFPDSDSAEAWATRTEAELKMASDMPSSIAQVRGIHPVPIPNFCGIYFLCHQGRVVYVGRSQNIVHRLAVHSATKDFDCAYALPVAEKDVNKVEKAFIRAFEPELNRNGVDRGPGLSATDIKILLKYGLEIDS